MSGLSDLAEEFPERRKLRTRRGKKRYCPHGHEYTAANSIMVLRPGRAPTKRCRKCHRASSAKWKQRTGYKAKANSKSRIGRARELLQRAAAVVDAGLAAEIGRFLTEGKA